MDEKTRRFVMVPAFGMVFLLGMGIFQDVVSFLVWDVPQDVIKNVS